MKAEWLRRAKFFKAAFAKAANELFGEAVPKILGDFFFFAPTLDWVGIANNGGTTASAFFLKIMLRKHYRCAYASPQRWVKFFDADGELLHFWKMSFEVSHYPLRYCFYELRGLLHFLFYDEVNGFVIDGLVEVVGGCGFAHIGFYGNINCVVSAYQLLLFVEAVIGVEFHILERNLHKNRAW